MGDFITASWIGNMCYTVNGVNEGLTWNTLDRRHTVTFNHSLGTATPNDNLKYC